MRIATLTATAALALCASPAHAGPMYFSLEYTGDANLGAMTFKNAHIRAEAKGTTEEITTSATAQGPLHSMPVSMVITFEGLGPVDIASDLWFYSYSDFGVAGFGPSINPSHNAASFIGLDLAGFDLTTSIGPVSLLAVAGTPTTLLATAFGPLSLGEGQTPDAMFLAVAANPAPGTPIAFTLAGVLGASRRRRYNRSV